MSRKKKDKKKSLKTNENVEENPKLDIILLLKNELMDTKPNMAKFLKTYVKLIRVFTGNKIEMYPQYHYDISKIFVTFNDNHQLIRERLDKDYAYYMYDGIDEIPLKEKEKESVSQFFDFLLQFKFVY